MKSASRKRCFGRVNVHAQTIRSLMQAGLIREQPPETITGPVRTMHLTERGKSIHAAFR
jgi:hypothetical protein